MGTKADQEIEAMQAVHGALKNLSEGEEGRVIDWVIGKLNLFSHSQSSAVAPSLGHIGAAGPKPGATSLSAKEFLAEKRPKTDVERVACLAYYLTHFRETPEFKT